MLQKKILQYLLILIIMLSLGLILSCKDQQAENTGFCPMCGQSWDGSYKASMQIPVKLNSSVNDKWIKDLQEVLKLELYSKKQYTADYKKFDLHMPYHRVIPQEENHIKWITQLLKGYERSADVKPRDVKNSESIEEAYRYARTLEAELVPRYEQLIANTKDEKAREVLDTILLQTRMHYSMFDHALRMGPGRGMMGPGHGMHMR